MLTAMVKRVGLGLGLGLGLDLIRTSVPRH
jgi:hypothetical protein